MCCTDVPRVVWTSRVLRRRPMCCADVPCVAQTSRVLQTSCVLSGHAHLAPLRLFLDDCDERPPGGHLLSIPCPYLSLVMEHCYSCFAESGIEEIHCEGWTDDDIRRQCESPTPLTTPFSGDFPALNCAPPPPPPIRGLVPTQPPPPFPPNAGTGLSSHHGSRVCHSFCTVFGRCYWTVSVFGPIVCPAAPKVFSSACSTLLRYRRSTGDMADGVFVGPSALGPAPSAPCHRPCPVPKT